MTWLTIAMLAALLAGCPSEQQSDEPIAPGELPGEPRPSVALRLVVVNEPELAEAISRLRGEWAERSGGELSVFPATWADLSGAKGLDADAIVFPSRYLGELAVRNWLRPVRANVLASDDLRAAEFLPLVRHELIQWGGQVMALPLGVHLPETGENIGRRPALSFLAQAALRVISKERLGVFFDTETMKPRIAEPPFVDALTQLVASNNGDASVQPTNARSVPVLGYSDRLIAVTTSSRNAASAFKLIEWLAQADTSSQIARAGEGTMPVRRSLASSSLWYDESLAASERADVGKTLESVLSQPECLLIPRIPGVDDYMTALDKAVHEVLSDGVAPHAALEKASQRWDAITDAHGREAQRKVYLKHLGIIGP